MSIKPLPVNLMNDSDIILYVNVKDGNTINRRVLRRIPIDVLDRKVVKNMKGIRGKSNSSFVFAPGAEIAIWDPIEEEKLKNAQLYAYGFEKALRGEITLDKLQKLTEPLVELPVAAEALESYHNLNVPRVIPGYASKNQFNKHSKSRIIPKSNSYSIISKNNKKPNVYTGININNNNNYKIQNRTKYAKSKRPSKTSKLAAKYRPNTIIRNIMRKKNTTRKHFNNNEQ